MSYRHGTFLSAGGRGYACSGLYSLASPGVGTAQSLLTSCVCPHLCVLGAFEYASTKYGFLFDSSTIWVDTRSALDGSADS